MCMRTCNGIAICRASPLTSASQANHSYTLHNCFDNMLTKSENHNYTLHNFFDNMLTKPQVTVVHNACEFALIQRTQTRVGVG